MLDEGNLYWICCCVAQWSLAGKTVGTDGTGGSGADAGTGG